MYGGWLGWRWAAQRDDRYELATCDSVHDRVFLFFFEHRVVFEQPDRHVPRGR